MLPNVFTEPTLKNIVTFGPIIIWLLILLYFFSNKKSQIIPAEDVKLYKDLSQYKYNQSTTVGANNSGTVSPIWNNLTVVQKPKNRQIDNAVKSHLLNRIKITEPVRILFSTNDREVYSFAISVGNFLKQSGYKVENYCALISPDTPEPMSIFNQTDGRVEVIIGPQ